MKSKDASAGNEDYDKEPLFQLLVSYMDGDRAKAAAEVRPLVEAGSTVRDACEVVIASGGFEASFYR